MSEQGSLKTRSEAAGSTASSAQSSVRRRALISQLKAEQAKRVAEEKIRAAAARAQLAQDEARAEAQQAADRAEVDALELRLMEEEERASQEERSQPGTSRCLGEDQHGAQRGIGGCLEPPDQPRNSLARTRDWLETTHIQPDVQPVASPIPTPSPANACSSLPKVKLGAFDGSPLEWPKWISLFRVLVHNNRSLTDTERMLQCYTSSPP